MTAGNLTDSEWPSGASIVIISLLGRDDVFLACESALCQRYSPLEVIVYLDSKDESRAAEIERRFSGVRLIRVDRSRSYIEYRNRGFREARGAYVFWIDDDAYFTGAETIAEAVGLLRQDISTAAVAMRYVEPDGQSVAVPPHSALRHGDKTRGFVGCSVGFRRDAVLALHGMRELFFAYGEERDLAIRMLDAGYNIRYVDSPPIAHMVSPLRNKAVQSSYAVRNTILFDYFNIPFPEVVGKIVADAIKLIVYKITWKTAWERIQFVAWGFKSCFSYFRLRRPIKRSVYRNYHTLPRAGAEHWPPEAIPPHLQSPSASATDSL